MSQVTTPIASVPARPVAMVRRRRRTSLAARGEPMVWLTGGCVAIAVLMITILMVFILSQGLATFWPGPVDRLVVKTGDQTEVVLGEPVRHDVYSFSQTVPLNTPTGNGPGVTARVIKIDKETAQKTIHYDIPRTLYKTGNFDITGKDYVWVEERKVIERSKPQWAMVIERTAWGNAYGTPEAIVINGQTFAGSEAAWKKFKEVHSSMRALADQIRAIEKNQMGAISHEQDALRLELAETALRVGTDSQQYKEQVRSSAARQQEMDGQLVALRKKVVDLQAKMETARLIVRTPQGQILSVDRTHPDDPMLVSQVVRAYPANQLTLTGKIGVYVSRWWEYLSAEPREANTEGGVWPAIVGTVMLTLVMVIFVVPIGVIAALYLREYAKQGPLVAFVRISVNNLAGVPSIVYGVFGLGFFCYIVGRFIDRGPDVPMVLARWSGLAIATVALVGIAAGLTLFLNIFTKEKERGRAGQALTMLVFLAWLASAALVVFLVWTTPFFHGFFPARAAEGTPTLGKSAMIWASLTLSLLTLPLVIVATEEALSAVPRSMREGSFACGASKWQTIRRIVLPRAMPGVMTGMILAIARGAGEVAPIMLVGAVKLAPELPISVHPSELFGLNRSFMHLGFHIFDLAFQSRNSLAALPMAYTTTFLLILIVVLLNLSAIFVRSRLRKAYAGGSF